MKVYDTDEDAIAVGARKKMFAKGITFAIMALFSGLGIWLAYTFFFAPDTKSTALAPSVRIMMATYTDPTAPSTWHNHASNSGHVDARLPLILT